MPSKDDCMSPPAAGVVWAKAEEINTKNSGVGVAHNRLSGAAYKADNDRFGSLICQRDGVMDTVGEQIRTNAKGQLQKYRVRPLLIVCGQT